MNWLSGYMKGRYCSMRLKKYKEEQDPWPPIKTKSYATLALVHQKELQTRQETTATIYLRAKGDIHKIPQTIDTKKLADITQIFDPVLSKIPNNILIEGHPGIGKTTLVKEICMQWAEGKLLASDRLVLMLLLRDPNVQKITNEQELIEHFTNYSVDELYNGLFKNHGANITLIIDGFDELSTELRHNSFFRKLIEKELLPCARIVVTSRPSASVCLHHVVDRRIEILGFERSSKKQYVTEALQDSPSKLEKLQRHFQQYPAIDSICYVPLVLSIIVFLCMCQPDELPTTATKMYADFILHIICHYLKRKGKIPDHKIINKLEQFPPVVSVTLQSLGKIAFDGLINDKIVFTVEDLPMLHLHDPTCYGLLQSTECYSAEEIGTSIHSFNFLHLGIQEYFAAKHVTKLPDDEVYRHLSESFIDNRHTNLAIDGKNSRLSNMWILYCGITRGRCSLLRHYLATCKPHIPSKNTVVFSPIATSPMSQKLDFASGHTRLHDSMSHSIAIHGSTMTHGHLYSPRDHMFSPSAVDETYYKSSHMFLSACMSTDEPHDLVMHNPSIAHDNTYMLPVKTHFTNTTISDQKASYTVAISQDILKNPVNVLYLFQCFQEAQDNVLCDVLSESFCNGVIDISGHRLLPHQIVSLGFFLSRLHRKWKKLSSWGCYIGDYGMNILHQYLCGDKANKLEVAKINLGNNDLTGASSHLIGDIICHLQPHTLQLDDNNITNMRDISIAVTTSAVKALIMDNNDITSQEAVAIGDMMICLEDLKLHNNKLGDHGAELLSECLTNTKILRVLNISDNNIGPSGTIAIANALVNNTSLEQLYMSRNLIGQDGAMAIAKAFTNNKKLQMFLLCDDDDNYDVGDNYYNDYTIDGQSAMMIINSLYCNNTIVQLALPIGLHHGDNYDLVTREAKKVNTQRKLHNQHIIGFHLLFIKLQNQKIHTFTYTHIEEA